jgi:hypothetical protein
VTVLTGRGPCPRRRPTRCGAPPVRPASCALGFFSWVSFGQPYPYTGLAPPPPCRAGILDSDLIVCTFQCPLLVCNWIKSLWAGNLQILLVDRYIYVGRFSNILQNCDLLYTHVPMIEGWGGGGGGLQWFHFLMRMFPMAHTTLDPSPPSPFHLWLLLYFPGGVGVRGGSCFSPSASSCEPFMLYKHSHLPPSSLSSPQI